jgi:hypothetical protein
MGTAALCPYVYSVATFASVEHRIQEFSGVSARFTLLSRSVRVNEPLRVMLTLRNSSDPPIDFRHLSLLHHADLFGSDLERVMKRFNAPLSESPACKTRLKPGETVHRTEDIALSALYDLAPGNYKLGFKYDLRLLPVGVRKAYQKTLHSEDWVTWDDTLFEFNIRP